MTSPTAAGTTGSTGPAVRPDTRGRPGAATGKPIKVAFRGVPVEVEHPSGGTAQRLCEVTALSGAHLVLLTRGYLHEGTLCSMRLVTADGVEQVLLTGRSGSCRLAGGGRHEVAVKLDQRIDPRDFLPDSRHAEVEDEPIGTPELMGDVLLLDDQEAVCRIVDHHLRKTQIHLHTAHDVGRALDVVKRQRLDLVICDLELGDQSGFDALASLREAGYRGPVIATTGLQGSPSSPPGVVAVLRKPFAPEELRATMLKAMSQTNPMDGTAPICSLLRSDGEAEPLVDWYVSQIGQLLRMLDQAVEHNDKKAAIRVSTVLHETGSLFGYPTVSEAAQKLTNAMHANPQPSQCSKELADLRSVCGRVQ